MFYTYSIVELNRETKFYMLAPPFVMSIIWISYFGLRSSLMHNLIVILMFAYHSNLNFHQITIDYDGTHFIFIYKYEYRFTMLLTLSVIFNSYNVSVSPRIHLVDQTIEFYIFRYPTSTRWKHFCNISGVYFGLWFLNMPDRKILISVKYSY